MEELNISFICAKLDRGGTVPKMSGATRPGWAGRIVTPAGGGAGKGRGGIAPILRQRGGRIAAGSEGGSGGGSGGGGGEEPGLQQKDELGDAMREVFPPGRGEKIFLGVFRRPVEEEAEGGDPEALERKRAELRAQAARDLTNIDAEERELRKKAGLVRYSSLGSRCPVDSMATCFSVVSDVLRVAARGCPPGISSCPFA